MKKYLSWTTLLISMGLSFYPTAHSNAPTGFALSEHWAMGQQVTLRFDMAETPEAATPLHLKNGLALTIGDIISLGDLYGIVGKPISYGSDKHEKQARFKEAFKSFSTRFVAVNEVTELNAVIKMELGEVEAGIEKGETAEEIYKRIGYETARKVNCITGGGCTTYGWWLFPGRYLLLATENFDHFSPNNLIAYKSGHQVALKQALKAKRTGKRADLELAYAMDAFATHFLSDHYAAGHQRTPRQQLKDTVTPAVLGSLLAHYMHNEENKYGLQVHNEAGEQWRAYGDFSYFNPMNQANRQMLLKTLQQSADEVFHTYYYGVLPEKNSISEMIPETDKLTDGNNADITPMFVWDEATKQLFRRADLSNPYDKKLINNWWGWSTLFILKRQYGVTSTIQISLMKYLSQFKPKDFDENMV